jgi:predicted dehydrogenase
MGMVGGGQGAFIGAVHRMAARLDQDHGGVEFVAGALSSTPEKSVASARKLGLSDDRCYPSWQAMLERESSLPAGKRIDFVSIVTPNHTHFEIADAFAGAGFNVVLDKPMVHTSEQAAALAQTVKRSGVVFAVTYNYSGYPLVKQARHLVQSGELGEIRKVIVEYNQGWLATKLEETGQKQADWRTDPSRSGVGGCIGDIGSHAEQLTSYITGLQLDAICADLTTFVPGRQLDDDASVLLRFANGAKGILMASQVAIGAENDLRIRVFGTKGSLAWQQEEPNRLIVCRDDGSEHVYRRGSDALCDAATRCTRLPGGHPEAFIEAFANVYRNACDAMRARRDGEGVDTSGGAFDYPDITEGARGVKFIEQTVASSHGSDKWTPIRVA